MQLQNTLHLLLVVIYLKPVYKIRRNRHKNPPILRAYCSTYTHPPPPHHPLLSALVPFISLWLPASFPPTDHSITTQEHRYTHYTPSFYSLFSPAFSIPPITANYYSTNWLPPDSGFETSTLACSRGLVTPRTYLSSPYPCKKSKTTTPRIPMWSPTMVLTKRYSAWLRRSDGMRYFLSPMAVDVSMFLVHSYTGTATPDRRKMAEPKACLSSMYELKHPLDSARLTSPSACAPLHRTIWTCTFSLSQHTIVRVFKPSDPKYAERVQKHKSVEQRLSLSRS